MSTNSNSILGVLWRKWKSIKLPWRKRWLAGTDLVGNSYYYFRPTLSSPHRRILQPSIRTHLSDVNVTPQWHQWLRHTRASPPSLYEQQQDIIRQQQLKMLAKAADERWESKVSVLDAPRRGNQELGVGDGEGVVGTVGRRGESAEVDVNQDISEAKGKKKENPWKKQERKGPGEGYQPETWTPMGPAKR